METDEQYPFKCHECGLTTGFKSKPVDRMVRVKTNGSSMRASCRRCGHIREDARA